MYYYANKHLYFLHSKSKPILFTLFHIQKESFVESKYGSLFRADVMSLIKLLLTNKWNVIWLNNKYFYIVNWNFVILNY